MLHGRHLALRNRLKLPSSVDGLNYSYEADEGSSVADISAEVSAASGWVALAGHRGESVTLSFAGFVSGYDCGEEDHDDAQHPHTVRQHLGWGIAWGYFHYAPDSSIRVPLTENPAHDAPGAWTHCGTTAASAPGICTKVCGKLRPLLARRSFV